LAQLADIRRVLIVARRRSRASGGRRFSKFSGRSTQIVIGSGDQRAEQYRSDAFFTICNYEQVLRDLSAIENVPWDLIILDEGQRIKNYESKTSNVIGNSKARFDWCCRATPRWKNRLGRIVHRRSVCR